MLYNSFLNQYLPLYAKTVEFYDMLLQLQIHRINPSSARRGQAVIDLFHLSLYQAWLSEQSSLPPRYLPVLSHFPLNFLAENANYRKRAYVLRLD